MSNHPGNSLQSLQHGTITSFWKNTIQSMNVPYVLYKNTKNVLKVVRQLHTEKLHSQLPSQGFIITFLLKHSLTQLNSVWSSTQSSLPKNISNFAVPHLKNTLANHINLYKCKPSSSPDCSFCLKPESLLYIIADCKSYLEDGRYMWRHYQRWKHDKLV